jgi:FkbM family methyltransferase
MIMPLEKIIKDINLDIRGVLHIGAHYGQEYNDYHIAGVRNMIFFEPVLSNFAALVCVIPNTPNIRAYRLALGNESKKVDMFIETANKGQSCSVLEPGTHLTMYPNIKFTLKETVNMERLDNISFDRGLFNMINMDVQGFELEVLKGAVDTLPFIDIIYTEVNTEEVYKGCAIMHEIDSFLWNFGFMRVCEAFPYGKAWGDALYIKQ